MRETYDRLVGPVAIRMRGPDRSTAMLDPMPQPRLVPIELGKWKVIAGTRPTADLRRELAEHADADDEAIERLAMQFGLRAGAPAIDAERAGRLVRTVRAGSVVREEAPLRHPLVIYPEGEDPRGMWKTHVTPEFLARDRADDIADAIAWCLRSVAGREEHAEWRERGAVVARRWTPSDGAARLYRLAAAEVRRTPALDRAGWVPVFTQALLFSGTKVRDARSLWHALVGVGPLLLAMAEAGSQANGKPAVDILSPSSIRWKQLAVEADAWVAAIDELAIMDEELGRSRPRRKASEKIEAELTEGIRSAITTLRDKLHAPGFDLYHRVHDLEATDTQGIRLALEDAVNARLAEAGVSPETPPGTLIGLEAAMLLSVHASLGQGRCVICGRRTVGQRSRCGEHQRAVWRERKRKQRRTRGARANPRFPGRSARKKD